MKKYELLINYILNWTGKEEFITFINSLKEEGIITETGVKEVELTNEITDYIYELVDVELERREKLGEDYLSEYRELTQKAIEEFIEEVETDDRYFWYFITYRILDTLNIEY